MDPGIQADADVATANAFAEACLDAAREAMQCVQLTFEHDLETQHAAQVKAQMAADIIEELEDELMDFRKASEAAAMAHEEKEMSLGERMKDVEKGAAVRLLSHAFTKQLRGEMAMRIQVWTTLLRLDKEEARREEDASEVAKINKILEVEMKARRAAQKKNSEWLAQGGDPCYVTAMLFVALVSQSTNPYVTDSPSLARRAERREDRQIDNPLGSGDGIHGNPYAHQRECDRQRRKFYFISFPAK